MVSVPASLVSQWERGVRKPKLISIEKISAALGCPITDLIESADPEHDAPNNAFASPAEIDDLKLWVKSILVDDLRLGEIVPLLERIASATPAPAPRRGHSGLRVESTELHLNIPDPPGNLLPLDRDRWNRNADTLRRWSETQYAAGEFPYGVPGWAMERFCRQVVNFYEGGSLKDVGGTLWDIIEEGSN